jgi:light-regulated signal transduction histidine kinase (bacteriophytochrome)
MPSREAAGVNLSACDDEQIHLLGAIQGAGYLLSVDAEWTVIRASQNASEFLGLAHEDLLGRQIDDVISPETMHSVRNRMLISGGPGTVERLLALPLPDGKLYDISVHSVGRETVLEIEPGGGDGSNAPALLRTMVNRLQAQKSITYMYREAARQIRALTGFNRIMVYRFDQDGSGEVVAEAVDRGLQPYLGLHYPASDIPRQARVLYERNLLRIIFDVDAKPVPIIPEISLEGEKLDLSMSVLRSVSPVHLEYLRNMGVQCSMSISILREGRLWGLIACHHNTPTRLSLETRTVAELFGQMFSYVLEVRQRQEDAAYDRQVLDVHNRIATIFSTPDINLDDLPATLVGLADYIEADGVGIYQAGKITLNGITPTAEEFQLLVKHLNKTAPGRVFATNHLAASYPAAADYPMRAAGILCIPVSRTPRDYLIFFRRNIVKVMNWAGEPVKAEATGPNGVRLTPRKSFEAWRQIVEDKSAPWSPRETRAAEGLRIRLVEQVLRMTEAAKTDRETADQHSEILIAELNHRIRNILGLVRGLVKQSALSSDSIRALVDNVDDRIRSLARA